MIFGFMACGESMKTYATTQRTSKILKLQIALANLAAIVGGAWWIFDLMMKNESGFGSAILGIGLVWRVVTGILIWWFHE